MANFPWSATGRSSRPKGTIFCAGSRAGRVSNWRISSTILLREAEIDPYDVRKADEAWSEEVGVDIAAQAREYAGMMDTWTP